MTNYVFTFKPLKLSCSFFLLVKKALFAFFRSRKEQRSCFVGEHFRLEKRVGSSPPGFRGEFGLANLQTDVEVGGWPQLNLWAGWSWGSSQPQRDLGFSPTCGHRRAEFGSILHNGELGLGSPQPNPRGSCGLTRTWNLGLGSGFVPPTPT